MDNITLSSILTWLGSEMQTTRLIQSRDRVSVLEILFWSVLNFEGNPSTSSTKSLYEIPFAIAQDIFLYSISLIVLSN